MTTSTTSTTSTHAGYNLLLADTNNRFVLFPIKDLEIWNMYKKAEASLWVAGEVDLSKDISQWNALDDNSKHFIKNVIGFFAASDGIVGENIAINLYSVVKLAEARQFYAFQIQIEHVHSEVYSLLIDKYITNPSERDELFNSVSSSSTIAKKAQWAIKWISSSGTRTDASNELINTLTDAQYNELIRFAENLVAFASVEGIFFSGSFCAIFWLKKQLKMSGLCQANDFISRDEALHCEFAIMLYRKLGTVLTRERILEIVTDAVSIESEFITESLPCSLIGMDSKKMIQYIQFCADRLIQQLGYTPHYGSTNPFDFMEMISVESKVNFFEHRVTEYRKSTGVHGNEMDDSF